MIVRNTKASIVTLCALSRVVRYNYVPHDYMDKVKESLFGKEPLNRPLAQKIKLKAKYLWRQTKYTVVQGFKDLKKDILWLRDLRKKKQKSQRTGYEQNEVGRIKVDLLKFIPYSFFLVVPFTELGLPLYLYLFPNSIPSQFVFDTAYNKYVEKIEIKQQQAHALLIEKLIEVLSKSTKSQEQFLDPVTFKKQFFQGLHTLETELNYQNMNSNDLITVANFLGMEYVTGTEIINKLVHLFTFYLPKYTYKLFRWLFYLILRRTAPPYQDPWFVARDFKILRFNYFPFQFFKRRFLLYQINKHIKSIKMQDAAFEKYGLGDVENNDIRDFTRSRGITSISCYQSLRSLLKNEWVSVTTHPKFDNNATLWYSVIMYNFLKDKNKDLN